MPLYPKITFEFKELRYVRLKGMTRDPARTERPTEHRSAECIRQRGGRQAGGVGGGGVGGSKVRSNRENGRGNHTASLPQNQRYATHFTKKSTTFPAEAEMS